MLGTQYSGKMVGQMKMEIRVLKISPSHNRVYPPTGLGSPWRVRRETARTRVVFSLFMGTFWAGEVHVIEP
jgi:hypothetical protein